MRLPRLVSALLTTLALTTAAGAQQPAPSVITVPAFRGRPPRLLADTMGNPFEVPSGAGRVFSALVAVYADLKIPTEIRDSAQLQVGNQTFDRRGDVAGRRLSAYLECGEDMMGPRADFNRIDISLISFIKPQGADAVILRSVMLANAVNVGVRGTIPCQSTGELERRIYDLVQKKLGN